MWRKLNLFVKIMCAHIVTGRTFTESASMSIENIYDALDRSLVIDLTVAEHPDICKMTSLLRFLKGQRLGFHCCRDQSDLVGDVLLCSTYVPSIYRSFVRSTNQPGSSCRNSMNNHKNCCDRLKPTTRMTQVKVIQYYE